MRRIKRHKATRTNYFESSEEEEREPSVDEESEEDWKDEWEDEWEDEEEEKKKKKKKKNKSSSKRRTRKSNRVTARGILALCRPFLRRSTLFLPLGFQRVYYDTGFAKELLKEANDGADLPRLLQLWRAKFAGHPVPHRLRETRVQTLQTYTNKKNDHQRVHVRQFCPLREHGSSFRAEDEGSADTTDVLGAVQGYYDERTDGCLHLDPVVSGVCCVCCV